MIRLLPWLTDWFALFWYLGVQDWDAVIGVVNDVVFVVVSLNPRNQQK